MSEGVLVAVVLSLLALNAALVGLCIYVIRRPFNAIDKLDAAQDAATAAATALGEERLEHERTVKDLRDEIRIGLENLRAAAEATVQERRMRAADLADLATTKRHRDALLQAIKAGKGAPVADLVRAELDRLQTNAARSAEAGADTKAGGG